MNGVAYESRSRVDIWRGSAARGPRFVNLVSFDSPGLRKRLGAPATARRQGSWLCRRYFEIRVEMVTVEVAASWPPLGFASLSLA
jgi:hypothetical protein